MTTPMPLPNFVYKIYPTTSTYQIPIPHPSDFIFPQDPLDTTSGYCNMSSATQLPTTLGFFFESYETVHLVKINYKMLSDAETVKWELADDGNAYPHLYALLEARYVDNVKVIDKVKTWAESSKQLVEARWLES